MLKTSAAGLSLIRRFEGERLAAYRDGGGVLTIGVGHTGPDVHAGQTITTAESHRLFALDVRRVEAALALIIHVEVSQNAFDACVSLAFNVGVDAFRESTLLRKLNARDQAGAGAEFARWCHDGGRVVPGLVARRAAEAALFAR